jgi:hypothetical protein
MSIPLPDNHEHLEADDRELLDEEVIEEVAVYTPVIMDEDIPNTDDAMPVNRGVGILQFARETFDALADDNDAADDSILLCTIVAEGSFF